MSEFAKEKFSPNKKKVSIAQAVHSLPMLFVSNARRGCMDEHKTQKNKSEKMAT